MLDRLSVLLDQPDPSLQQQTNGEPPFDLLDLTLAIWAVLDFYSSNSPLMLLVVILQYPIRRSKMLASATIEALASAEVEVVPLDGISAAILPAAAGVVMERKNPAAQSSASNATRQQVQQRLVPARIQQEAEDDLYLLESKSAGLLDHLMSSLHLLVVGHSGGGKTTLIHELSRRWAAEGKRVVVLDPDAAAGLWSGCQVVGGGDDYDAIAGVLTSLRGLVARRRQQRSEGEVREFKDVYVVMDEYADIHANVPQARELVETILRRGRKLNVHLVLGVQDGQVKTLGFEGASSLKVNFSYIVDVMKRGEKRIALLKTFDGRESQTQMDIPELPNLEELRTNRTSTAVQDEEEGDTTPDVAELARQWRTGTISKNEAAARTGFGKPKAYRLLESVEIEGE